MTSMPQARISLPGIVLAVLLLSLLQLGLTAAATVQGRIAATDVLGNPILPLSSDTNVVLDKGDAGRALVRADGSFTLQNILPGDYILAVNNRIFTFPSLSVRILGGDGDTTVQVRPHTPGHLPGDPARVPTLSYPIQLKASGRFEYYESPQGFSILGMLKQNKMILFMVGGLAFAVGMPKLIALVDPDILKEVQESQAEMHRNLNSAQNMDISGSLSKLLSGAGAGTDAGAPAGAAAGSSGGRASPSRGSAGNARKRR